MASESALTWALHATNRSLRKPRPRDQGFIRSGESRARNQAPMSKLRREILRSEQGPDRLPQVRNHLPGGGAHRAARSAERRRGGRGGREPRRRRTGAFGGGRSG